jgi:hypothetical protein
VGDHGYHGVTQWQIRRALESSVLGVKQLLPREVVKHEANQEADAGDLDGERAEEFHPHPGSGRRRPRPLLLWRDLMGRPQPSRQRR